MTSYGASGVECSGCSIVTGCTGPGDSACPEQKNYWYWTAEKFKFRVEESDERSKT